MTRRDLALVLAAAMASARAVCAHQKAMSVIGYLGTGSGPSGPYLAAFREGLSEATYVEGRIVAIEFRWAEGHYDRLPGLATYLASRRVDVIVTAGTNAIAAAKAATSQIPIVFLGGGDLVAIGLVASLAHPGSNLTGISIFGRELGPKWSICCPKSFHRSGIIAALINPNSASAELVVRGPGDVVRFEGAPASDPKGQHAAEVDTALATLVQLEALVVASDPFFFSRRAQTVALAARYSVPAIYEWREFADEGGLISYGPNLTAAWRQAGVYVGRVPRRRRFR